MTVSVIIVAYNGVGHLELLIPSIQSQDVPGASLEVILLDNASSDGTSGWIKKNHPWIKLVESDKNLKFVGGNNMAVKEASGDIFLLLNQDVILAPGFIKEALAAFEKFPDASAVAVNVVFPNEMSVAEFTKAYPEDIPCRLFSLTAFGYAAYVPATMEYAPVNFLSGCGCFIKRSALQAGELLFDPRLDAYAEDTELSLRLADRGVMMIFAPRSALFHNQSWKRRGLMEGFETMMKIAWNRFYAISIHTKPSAMPFKYLLLLAGVPLKSLSLRLAPLKTVSAFIAGLVVAAIFAPLFPYWFYVSVTRGKGA
ncbi:MAG: glycosyltransferase family 2 protein [Nitrospinae bacterium]|nr:glycosyltransferase family 2 protein [Nitrospinota bacterium]